jgi:hypothetical protein
VLIGALTFDVIFCSWSQRGSTVVNWPVSVSVGMYSVRLSAIIIEFFLFFLSTARNILG